MLFARLSTGPRKLVTAVRVVVGVAVIVIKPVIVAALENGNDTVGVINAVDCRNRRMGAADSSSMLHFQKLDVYQRSIELLACAHRVRGSVMESASHLDAMRVDELIDAGLYEQGSRCSNAALRC